MAEWSPENIVVVGASGGIGSALVGELLNRIPEATIHGFSRSGALGVSDERLSSGVIDYQNVETIEVAAASLSAAPDLIIVATGQLHGENFGPEKSLRDLDVVDLTRSYLINTVGPVLVMKHFLPLLPRYKRSVFAALSARVGSISDNRLGGWYGYRASKAALNQMLKTASIEHARRFKLSAVIGLHPGTVDTNLSKPFQGNVAEGTLFTAEYAAGKLLDVIFSVSPEDTGRVFAWDGKEVPA